MARLDHVSLPAINWRRSRDWRCDVLGLWDEVSMREKGGG
jgi:hypothetical protein